MYKVTIIVPKADNGGAAFEPGVFDIVERNLITCAGGFSRSDVCGQWRDKGRVYTDYSYRYDIVTDQDGLNGLRDVVRVFKIRLKQLSMYFESYPVSIEYI